jgi:hypothetical protein
MVVLVMANNYATFSEAIVVNDKVAVEKFLDGYYASLDSGGDEWEGWGGVEIGWDKDWKDNDYVWIHAEEYFVDEELVYIVQGILTADKQSLPTTVGVAFTCSRPRIGEFGGGVYVIYKDWWAYCDPYTMAQKVIREHGSKR